MTRCGAFPRRRSIATECTRRRDRLHPVRAHLDGRHDDLLPVKSHLSGLLIPRLNTRHSSAMPRESVKLWLLTGRELDPGTPGGAA